MAATAADYHWWQAFRPEWSAAHCITLVGDANPAQVIEMLDGAIAAPSVGVDELIRRSLEHWDHTLHQDTAIVGVADIGNGWVQIAEVNGYLGVTTELIEAASAGRTIVAHFRNINAVSRFTWWRDGVLVTDLDLLFPTERFGTEPDALREDLAGVGIAPDAADAAAVDLSAAGFALAERITGVVCTPGMFERAAFTVAVVPIPSS